MKRIIIKCLWVPVVLVTVVFFIHKIRSSFMQIDKDSKEQRPSTFALSREDSSLISPSYKAKLKVDEIYHFVRRNSISKTFLDTRYHLITYRIDLLKNCPIADVFQIEK